MKICSLCQEEKPESEFYTRNRRGEKDLQSRCKICFKKVMKDIYDKQGGREKMQKYRKTPRGIDVHGRARERYENSKRGKETRKKYNEKFKELSGSWAKRTKSERRKQVAARNAIGSAIRFKRMPSARNFACIECGKQAQEYHHHKGYAQEYWLDVVPMCIKCHRNLDTRIHQSV